MFSNDRKQLRQNFFDAWQKHRAGEVLSPLEEMISRVEISHPEYHALLDDPEKGLDKDYLPEDGGANPFLHMAMHIGLMEQITTDRPSGIGELYRRLCWRTGESHEAEHQMMECMAQMLWDAQSNQRMPDEQAYLECIRRLMS